MQAIFLGFRSPNACIRAEPLLQALNRLTVLSLQFPVVDLMDSFSGESSLCHEYHANDDSTQRERQAHTAMQRRPTAEAHTALLEKI